MRRETRDEMDARRETRDVNEAVTRERSCLVSQVSRQMPPLRFKGFAGEWEEKRLGDAFGMTLSTNTLSRSCLSDCGVVKNIHYGDVLIKLPSVTDVRTTELPFVADDKFKVGAKNLLRDGDIVMADTAEDETVGKVTEVVGIGDQKVVSGLHTIVLRPNDDFGMGFLGYCLNAKGFHNELLRIMQGVKVFSVNKGALEDCRFFSPSVPAQQKLGEVFRSLDSLIASRETALEKLKALKEAMLEKMFPRAGDKVPEVRFKGFEGEWEKKCLEEIVTFSKGKGYSKSDITEEGYPLFLYGRMYTNYQIEVSSVETFCKLRDDSVLSKGGEVVCPASGETAEDIACASAVVEKGIVLGGDLNILTPRKDADIDSVFLALSLTYGMPRSVIKSRAQGKTVVHVHNSDFIDIDVFMPSLPEQRKIGAYFRSLDALISARRDEIAKLKDLKKALLDRMFV